MPKISEKKYAVLPLRDIVVFPGMIVPLFIGREGSIQALEEAMNKNAGIVLATQVDPDIEEVGIEDIYNKGVLCDILQFLKLPDGTVKILAEAKSLIQLENTTIEKNTIFSHVKILETINSLKDKPVVKEAIKMLVDAFSYYAKLSRRIPGDAPEAIRKVKDFGGIVDMILNYIEVPLEEQQEILELPSIEARLARFIEIVEEKIASSKLDEKIQTRVKFQMDKNQREFYLHEKMKAIQKELGEDEAEDQVYESKIKETNLPKTIADKVREEIKKLKKIPTMSAEGTVVRNYLDWIFDLPWNKKSQLKNNIKEANEILDADHYGLEKVKERILEHLSVQKRTGKTGGTVLCLVGPPGVGKTSLGQSIAKSVGREFVRISLGGVRDEADIRGHRRTYIGSQPGRIINAMKKAGTTNPLILLDEIDKMGSDWHGDPTSALLEVLDPSQNKTFNDHYIEADYDLSDVMFITTANSLRIPYPLLDRMEIINLSGYTEDEKMEIAKRHLIPNAMKDHGIKENEWSINDEAIRDTIRYYTREAGVRKLNQMIAKLIRKSLQELETTDKESIEITSENLKEYAGVKRFDFGRAHEKDTVGVVTGLAWTSVGGELLSIETVTMPGKGKFMITGKLGDVMKESIETAKSFVRSRAIPFGIHPKDFDRKDLHIHMPEGAVPKDGPSAGIGMCTAIVSNLTGIPVRKDIAMTGEITLQGRVLPIGGLKEKLLAALRGGIKTVLIPADNEKDLEEIPASVKEGLEIISVKTADEVLEHALTQKMVPLPAGFDLEKEYYGKDKYCDKPNDINR